MPKSVVTFLALVFAGSYGLAAIVFLTGRTESALALPLSVLCMLAPAIATLIVRRVYKEEKEHSWKKLGASYLPLGLLAPTVVAHLAFFTVLLVFQSGLETAAWLTPDGAGMLHPSEDARFGDQPITATYFPIKVALNFFINFLIVSILVLGEEYGWRGFLQPHMERKFGVRGGIVMVALIWALWHPGIKMATTDIPASALLTWGSLMLFGSGLFFGWLYHKTGSIWLVALSHGAVNHWAQFGARFLELDPQYEITAFAGIGIGITVMGLAFLLTIPRNAGVQGTG